MVIMSENFKQMQTPIGRLLQLYHIRNNRPRDPSLQWWRLFVSEFFAVKAVLRLTTKVQPTSFGAPQPDDFQTTEIPFEALPRIFQVKYENGPPEEILSLGQCQEIRTQGGYHVLCENAVEQAFYDYSVVNSYGKLKVSFTSGMKIVQYEFTVMAVDHWLPPQLHQSLHTEIQKLAGMLEDCSNRFRQAAAAGASLNPVPAQDALRVPTDLAKALVDYLEHNVITEPPQNKTFSQLLQVTDVVNTLGELMSVSHAKQASPLLALQQYGTLSERPTKLARMAANQMSNEDESKLSVQSVIRQASPHPPLSGKLSPLAAAQAATVGGQPPNGDQKAPSPVGAGPSQSPPNGMHTPGTPQSPSQQPLMGQNLNHGMHRLSQALPGRSSGPSGMQ